MGFVAIVDILAGPETGYLPLLSLGPAFASLSGSVRRTGAVGVLALIACLLLAIYDQILGTRQNTLTFASTLGVTAAAMVAAAIRARRERELADIRMVAEVAQRVLLRPVPRRVGPIHAAVRYVSAAARARIGGDLYEIVTMTRGVRLIVGDVQGKGLDAVETAAVVLGAFREAAHDEPDLDAVAARLEQALARQLTSEQFVTAVLAELRPDGPMELLNHGHPPPLIIRADGTVLFADAPDDAPPLGMATLADVKPPRFEVPFAEGDQMLLYTDGVTEARDHRGWFYPLIERAYLLQDPDPEAALDKLQTDLTDHVGGPISDDAAMLLLRRRDR
jgi:serine phosphatase RsbU (regulator of sigma subunit)